MLSPFPLNIIPSPSIIFHHQQLSTISKFTILLCIQPLPKILYTSLHLYSTLVQAPKPSVTKKIRATFLLPLASQKALCMPLIPFTKAYIIQVTILAINFFFFFFFFIHTLWIYEVILLLYFYSIFPCSLLLCNKDLAFLIFIGTYNV